MCQHPALLQSTFPALSISSFPPSLYDRHLFLCMCVFVCLSVSVSLHLKTFFQSSHLLLVPIFLPTYSPQVLHFLACVTVGCDQLCPITVGTLGLALPSHDPKPFPSCLLTLWTRSLLPKGRSSGRRSQNVG